MFERPQSDVKDVLPPFLNLALALSWIALFSFRSAGVFLLMFSGILTVAQLETFVDPALSRLYIVLLAATLVVIALRVLRGMQTNPPPMSSELHYPSATDLPPAPTLTSRPPEENS